MADPSKVSAEQLNISFEDAPQSSLLGQPLFNPATGQAIPGVGPLPPEELSQRLSQVMQTLNAQGGVSSPAGVGTRSRINVLPEFDQNLNITKFKTSQEKGMSSGTG